MCPIHRTELTPLLLSFSLSLTHARTRRSTLLLTMNEGLSERARHEETVRADQVNEENKERFSPFWNVKVGLWSVYVFIFKISKQSEASLFSYHKSVKCLQKKQSAVSCYHIIRSTVRAVIIIGLPECLLRQQSCVPHLVHTLFSLIICVRCSLSVSRRCVFKHRYSWRS